MNIPLVVISGNHDGAARMAVGASLLRKNGVVIAARPQDCFSPWMLEKNGEKVQIFTMPWMDVLTARGLLGESGEGLHTSQQCTEKLLGKWKNLFHPEAYHVLVGHCFVAGSRFPTRKIRFLWEKATRYPVKLLRISIMWRWDICTALSGREKWALCRSPLWYSVDEEHHQKSISIVEVTKEGISLREEKVCPLRRVRPSGRPV